MNSYSGLRLDGLEFSKFVFLNADQKVCKWYEMQYMSNDVCNHFKGTIYIPFRHCLGHKIWKYLNGLILPLVLI